MFHNRFARQPRYADPAQFPAGEAPTKPAATSANIVLLPALWRPAAWQHLVYRLAYQQALADTAPPAYLRRFFSVWN